ncbi:MAG: ABC transporter permease [Firmicutes bacterium]|nr:ABC transporter permease [Bacillota bacterium]
MGRYAWRKIWGVVLTAVLVSLLTFFIVQVLPGDPALLMIGMEGSPEAYARLRRELDLDKPAFERYLRWAANYMQGDWGVSWRYSLPVRELVSQAFPLSLSLAMIAVGVALVVAIPTGIYMAAKPESWGSRMLSVGTQVGLGLPQFWVGLLLIQLFAVTFNIFPAGGSSTWVSLVLPTITLALPRAAILSRFMRVGIAEALKQDYIRTAKAKGVKASTVFFKHALRNGSLGVVTVAGLQFSQLLAGTIVVEQVFGLPGLGQLLLTGVFQRDLPLVQAVCMLVVILILLFDLVFDLFLGALDPRIRYE